MKISVLDQAFSEYLNKKNQLTKRQKTSKKGVTYLSQLELFRAKHGNQNPDRELSEHEQEYLAWILVNLVRNLDPNHVGYTIFNNLYKQLTTNGDVDKDANDNPVLPIKPVSNPSVTNDLFLVKHPMGLADAPNLELPSDAVTYLARFLSNQELGRLSQVNRFFYVKTKEKREAREFVTHAFCARLGQVQRMYALNPTLLNKRADRVFDIHNRILENATGYQAALAAGDDEMSDWFFSRFVEQGAEEQRLLQYQEQLPNGWVDAEMSQEDIKAIHAVFKAISDAPLLEVQAARQFTNNASIPQNQTNLRVALDAFRAHFNPAGKVMPRGKLINHQLEILVLKLLDHHVANVWGPGKDKPNLCVTQVRGYLQGKESARGLQEIAYGLINIVKKRESAARTFKFRGVETYKIFPSGHFNGIGLTYCADMLGNPKSESFMINDPESTIKILETHLKEKNRKISRKYANRSQTRSKGRRP